MKMKYLLTYDGAIVSYDDDSNDVDKPAIRNSKDDVVKESDSIEGLLDGVILISTVRKPIIVREGKIEGIKFKNFRLDETEKLLGSAWLPRGFVYVAMYDEDEKRFVPIPRN